MSLASPAIAKRMGRNGPIRAVFGASTGSRIAPDRLSPTSEGYG